MESNDNVVHLRRAFRCVVCDSPNGEVREETILFDYDDGDASVQLTAVVPVGVCNDCGERVLGSEADKIKHEQVCEYVGVLTPDQIRELRRVLQLSREEMSELTGIGSASIARWELGTHIQSRAYDRYLQLLEVPGVKHKLDQLAGTVQAPSKLPDLQCLVPDDSDIERAAQFRVN